MLLASGRTPLRQFALGRGEDFDSPLEPGRKTGGGGFRGTESLFDGDFTNIWVGFVMASPRGFNSGAFFGTSKKRGEEVEADGPPSVGPLLGAALTTLTAGGGP